MTLEPGDIVLIPFPYTDLASHKRRPVVLLGAPDERGDFPLPRHHVPPAADPSRRSRPIPHAAGATAQAELGSHRQGLYPERLPCRQALRPPHGNRHEADTWRLLHENGLPSLTAHPRATLSWPCGATWTPAGSSGGRTGGRARCG